MKFRFLGCPSDLPKEDGIRKLSGLRGAAISKAAERLELYEKFTFSQLKQSGDIEKIKGDNPDKVHELRMRFPEGRFRHFFIISDGDNALILHIATKKKQKIDTDIDLAKQRAKKLRTIIK